jgi:CxxC-x17-CxxC domain-containing protein
MSKFPFNKSNAMRFLPKTKEQAESKGYIWVNRTDPIHEVTVEAFSLPDTIESADENILKEVIKCANCGRGYKVTKGEFDLLRKLNLPLPHECPKCRENRRFVRLNPPKLYKRTCAKCGKEIITAFSPERPEIVYCEKCYQQEIY